MNSIFKRSKGGIDFYSSKGVEPPKKGMVLVENMRTLGLLNDEEFNQKVAMLNGQLDNGDPIENSFDNLAAVSARAELLAPLARESRTAQSEMAVALLNEKVSDVSAHVQRVKDATRESWPKIRLWCDEPAKGGAGAKKSGKPRVPSDVVREVDDMVRQGQSAAATRRATAAANRGD